VVPTKQNLWETILIRFALPDFPQVRLDFGQMSLQISLLLKTQQFRRQRDEVCSFQFDLRDDQAIIFLKK